MQDTSTILLLRQDYFRYFCHHQINIFINDLKKKNSNLLNFVKWNIFCKLWDHGYMVTCQMILLCRDTLTIGQMVLLHWAPWQWGHWQWSLLEVTPLHQDADSVKKLWRSPSTSTLCSVIHCSRAFGPRVGGKMQWRHPSTRSLQEQNISDTE